MPQSDSSDSDLRYTVMIRPFTVFCKLNQIPFSDSRWFQQESHALNRTDGICPVCHAKTSMEFFASYKRYLVEWKEGEAAEKAVTVQRFQCSSCGHTHALLPSMLVPHSSYSLRFILAVLRACFLKADTVAGICETAGIAVSTLYRWKRWFFTHLQLLLGVLEAACTKGLCFLEGLDGDILRGFYRSFRISFLQQPRRTDRGRRFPDGAGSFCAT